MNFTQMTTFRAVMNSASLSDAAVKLGRSQPAVSAAIKALEDSLGLTLFERKGRKLIPVPEAQYLFAEVDDILSHVTRVRQTMQSLSVGQAGSLTVAAMPGPVSQIFPKFIASQLSEASDVSVSILARTSRQIAELARAQSVDFGFADALEAIEPEALFSAQVFSADCFVALPNTHSLAQKSEIAIEDLIDVPLGTLTSTHPQSRAIQTRFQTAQAEVSRVVESQTFQPVLHFVAAGRCCTILDPLSVYLVRGDDALASTISISPMRDPIRYQYALYEPRYRPISVVARTLREGWQSEIMRLLDSIKARPEAE